MIKGSLYQLTQWLKDQECQLNFGETQYFTGLSTDSRKIEPGMLYIALPGDHFDGHDFLQEVKDKGAVAALVDHFIDIDFPQCVVKDTYQALGKIGQAWRQQFQYPIIGLTGSNGKTSTKEMIAAILKQKGKVLVTQGNLNNHIGVPLMLSQMDETHDFAVLEMGANHFGEIAYLTDLVSPDIGLITNAGNAHLEGFGSIEGVAHAKGEIYTHLPEQAWAIINAEDTYFFYWQNLAQKNKQLSFALDKQTADISGHWKSERLGGLLTVTTPQDTFKIKLNLYGRHNGMNALAAIAVATVLGLTAEQIIQGLEAMQPVKGRLQPILFQEALVLNDTYNANPSSLEAGLKVLAELEGKRWLVLGDMGELGEEAKAFHIQMANLAKQYHIERIFAIGDLTKLTVEHFGAGAMHYPDHISLAQTLRQDLTQDINVLVKGSRFMKMETIVDQLVN